MFKILWINSKCVIGVNPKFIDIHRRIFDMTNVYQCLAVAIESIYLIPTQNVFQQLRGHPPMVFYYYLRYPESRFRYVT